MKYATSKSTLKVKAFINYLKIVVKGAKKRKAVNETVTPIVIANIVIVVKKLSAKVE